MYDSMCNRGKQTNDINIEILLKNTLSMRSKNTVQISQTILLSLILFAGISNYDFFCTQPNEELSRK